jgi:heme-degrading monooxygenase HmoA
MMKSIVAFSVVVLSSTACLEVAAPFEGPAFENGGQLKSDVPEGTYLVSATWIDIKNTPEAEQRFSELMDPLTEQIKTQPGLLGYSLQLQLLSNAGYRTLTIWENEEAMLNWVVSDNHAAAMAEAGDIAEDGGVVTWAATRDELPPTHEQAKQHLDEEGRGIY